MDATHLIKMGFGIWGWDLGFGMGFGIWDLGWDLGMGWEWDLGFGMGWDGMGFGTNGIWDFPIPNNMGGKYTPDSFWCFKKRIK